MLGGDLYIADRIMAERVEEHMRLAAGRRIARQAGQSTQERMAVRRSRLSQQVHIILSRLGYRPSALGRQME